MDKKPGPWRPELKAKSDVSAYQFEWRAQESAVAENPIESSSMFPPASVSLTEDRTINLGGLAEVTDATHERVPDKIPEVPPVVRNPGGTSTTSERNYIICGTKLRFPHDAYPSQIALMEKVLRCLTTDKNGLLESPTGSGKSLSLLCSSLAFIEALMLKEKARNATVNGVSVGGMRRLRNPGLKRSKAEDIKRSESSTLCSSPRTLAVSCANDSLDPQVQPFGSGFCGNGEKTKNPRTFSTNFSLGARKKAGVVFVDDPDDDFQPEQPPNTAPVSKKVRTEEIVSECCEDKIRIEEFEAVCSGSAETGNAQINQIPKIYYGTRTHKQIAQLIRELQKTSYKHIPMSILGSRDQYCVHPVVSRQKNKSELCQELLDHSVPDDDSDIVDLVRGSGCEYFGPARDLSHEQLKRYNIESFDVEDLVQTGKKRRFCPYFGSRELSKYAQIIFCPYNYLVDARVRDIMDIDLKGHIVIFDEGHNMEDAAREAASFTLVSSELQEATEDMRVVASIPDGRRQRGSNVKFFLKDLSQVCAELLKWIDTTAAHTLATSDNASKDYDARDFIQHLKVIGLGAEQFQDFKGAYEAVVEDKNAISSQGGYDGKSGGYEHKVKKVLASTINILRGIVIVLDYLYRDNGKHVPDYKIVLSKERARNLAYNVDQQRFRSKSKLEEQNRPILKLNFWCLNPGVAFGDFTTAKSVLLTSGTLSPMTSFQSELAMTFGVQFEANHVINMNQVWAGAIGCGPRRAQLYGNWKTGQTLAYQDEIGDIVAKVCELVPRGVLCFFTSYNVLDTMLTRWQLTDVAERILKRKVVFQEPRISGDKSAFDEILSNFYEAIKGSALIGEQDGALMFAVCRGKVSEGLDFADNNARAVITIGIPFPNYTDPQVVMKRAYNDANVKRGLLNGSAWYDIQAFRAINQALGRCIRHKNDWGALILLDSRFTTPNPSNKFVQGLSKWIRPPHLKGYLDFKQAMDSLEEFVQTRIALEPEDDENLLTDDEMSSLFTSDEDFFSPQKI